ncbi:MAG: ABC transporter permease [Rhodospirillales bacterium]
MESFGDAARLAAGLVIGLDADLAEIVGRSLRVSLTAVVFAALIGLPVGAAAAVGRFWGRGALVAVLNALMGLPPVVVGLMVYMALSNAGPFGWMQLLYTPSAMIIAQTILVAPLIAALSRQIISDLHAEYAEQFLSFGVSGPRAVSALLWDARFSLMTVGLAGFGRAIAEVGAVIVVGGNIDHLTRVMTTAIALETSKGDLALALALGIILLLIALSVNIIAMSLNTAAQRHAAA